MNELLPPGEGMTSVLTAAEQVIREVAVEKLRPVLEELRHASVDMPPLELMKIAAQISGFIPGVGRIAVLARGEYRRLKLKSKTVRAQLYREYCTRGSSARAKLDADNSTLYMAALDRERLAQARADELGSLHEDLVETLNGVKKAIEAAKVDAYVSGQGGGP